MATLANPAAAAHANESAMISMTRAANARGAKNVIATRQLATVTDQTKKQAQVQRWQRYMSHAQQVGAAKAEIAEAGRSTTTTGSSQLLGRFDMAAEQDMTRTNQNEDNVINKLRWDHHAAGISADFDMQAAFDTAHAQMKNETLALLTGMFSDSATIASAVGSFT